MEMFLLERGGDMDAEGTVGCVCVCVRVRARGHVHVCEHVAFHKDDLRFLKGERSSVVGLIQRDLQNTFICLIPHSQNSLHILA